jgi:hypothetical protein
MVRMFSQLHSAGVAVSEVSDFTVCELASARPDGR